MTLDRLIEIAAKPLNSGHCAQPCIAVGKAGFMLTTTDGGDTWSLQTGVVVIDERIATIVGDLGTILRTTTGGVNK